MTSVYLSELPPEVVAFFCNGCGPKKVDPTQAASWWVRIVRSIRPPQWHSEVSCNQHDIDYKCGGTDEDRRQYDYDLRVRMIHDAKTRPWWQQPWYRLQAWIYWAFVRVFGDAVFHHGKKRTAVDLINLYQKLVRAQNA